MGWQRWRDRLLGDPAIRTRIGRLPLGGRIASRHARRLFGTVAGFAASQMLAAAVELGVFAALRDGPRAWDDLTDLPPAGAAALRQALLAAGLIEQRGGRVALTLDGLVVASDSGLRAMIAHNRLLYVDLADPVAMLRGEGHGSVAAFWCYEDGVGDASGYSTLMNASHAIATDALVDDAAFKGARHVMDVGGGRGGLLLALRRRHRDLALTLVDLPAVVAGIDLAAERIAVHGVEPHEALPVGSDAVVLMRVLHDHDDDAAARLLGRVAAALPAGGHVIVAEPMALPGRDPQTVYFAAYFAAMRSGRLRTPEQVAALLRAAGFTDTRHRLAGPLVQIVSARRVLSTVDV